MDEDMQPNKCGLLVTVEKSPDQTQRLHVTEVWPQVPLSSYQKVDSWAQSLKTTWRLSKYHELQP
jgi:hypothetical protein